MLGGLVLWKRPSRFSAAWVCAVLGPTASGGLAEAPPAGLGLQDVSGGELARRRSFRGAMQEEEVK